MAIEINEESVKQGLLGLVLALVEIIVETLKHQAVRRMEGGSLTDEEIERLGRTLKELDQAVEAIKEDYGIKECVRSVREGLDSSLNGILTQVPRHMEGDTARKESAVSGQLKERRPEVWKRVDPGTSQTVKPDTSTV